MNHALSDAKHIWVDVDDGVVTATLAVKELMNPTVIREMAEELRSLVDGQGQRRLILDFTHVGYMSSAALNKLIVLDKWLRDLGGRLVLCSLRPEVEEVLTLTRLIQKFAVERDRAAAKKRLIER